MSKSQKIWFWVSVAMFIILEIFFSFIPSFFYFLLGYGDFPSLVSKILTDSFLESNPAFIFFFIGIEFLSLISLFIFNIKFNNHKVYKFFLAVFLGIFIVVLSFVFWIGYSITNINFP